MERDEHLEQTENPLRFLARLDADPELAARCERTDLFGRIAIAAEMGLPFEEAHFRRTVRSWDLTGRWNRWLARGRVNDTVDGLPPLTSEHRVTDEDRAAYTRDGYVVLRGVLAADEVAACRPVFESALAQFDAQTPCRMDHPSQRAFIQVINTRTRGVALRHIMQAQRFARIAADLLQVEAVRVYSDQLLYKEPESTPSHAHQDHTYFPLDTDKIVTIWLALVDVSEDMGPLVYAPGSHLPGDLGFKPDYDDARTEVPSFVRERGYAWRTTGPLAAGDATLHHGWVIHGALANRGSRVREALSITYYPDGTPLAEPANVYQRRALGFMYPGKKPGDPAASDLTPVTYARTNVNHE